MEPSLTRPIIHLPVRIIKINMIFKSIVYTRSHIPLSLLVQVNGAEADSFSESLSRTTSSLFSDEAVPVIGRRAQRMKQLNNSGSIYSLSHSTLSDSDRSDYDTTVIFSIFLFCSVELFLRLFL